MVRKYERYDEKEKMCSEHRRSLRTQASLRPWAKLAVNPRIQHDLLGCILGVRGQVYPH